MQVENDNFIFEYFAPEGPTPAPDADKYDPEVGKAHGLAFGGWVAKWASFSDSWSLHDATTSLRYRRQGYLRSEDVSALHPSLAAQDSWQTLTDNRDENPTIEADWDKPHLWKCEKAPKFCSTPGVSIRMADKTALDAAESACVDAILARRRATSDAAACPIILRNANRYLGNNIFKRWWPVRVEGKLKRTGGRFEYVTNKAGKENSNRCISYSSREKR